MLKFLNCTQKYVSLLKIFEIIKFFKVSSDGDLNSSESEDIKPKINKKQAPFSDYLNIENKENETIISYDKSFEKVLKKKNTAFLNRLIDKKKNTTFLFNNGSDWEAILLNRLKISDRTKQIEKLINIVEKVFEKLNGLSEPELITNELSYIKEKKDQQIIKNISKKIKYIRRSETDHFTSFYNTVSYGYFEQIMTEISPFNSLLKLLKKITNKTFVMINPFDQNLEKSYSADFEVARDYIVDILISFSQEMIVEFEKKKNMSEFRFLMAKKLENKMKSEKMFRLLAIILVKSLVCEECIIKEHSLKIQNNLLNEKEVLEFENIEYVCSALNIKIKLYGYTVETKKGEKEKHFEKIHKLFGKKLEEDFTLILYYGDGSFSLAYEDI